MDEHPDVKTSVVVKLCRIAMYIEDFLAHRGWNASERTNTQALLADPEVRDLIRDLREAGLLPKE
jgi:hypothetical protein